ncbi:MAG: AI-2E family transporter [Verrucomicrobiae bacterium]|nr:AI-2E family transporter [Verrucomicrobiae bacterium]
MTTERFPTPLQRALIWRALAMLALVTLIAMGAGVLALFLYGLVYFQSILLPLILGALLAFLLDPVVEWMVRRRVPRDRASGYVLALVGVIAIIGGFFILPQIISELHNALTSIPGGIHWLQDKLQSLHVRSAQENWWIQGDQVNAWLQQKAPVLAQRAFEWLWGGVVHIFSAFGLLLGLVVIPVYCFYFLKEKPALQKHWHKYIPLRKSAFREEVLAILTEIKVYLTAFFRVQLAIALLMALAATGGMLFMGLHFALLLGLLTFFLALLPYGGFLTFPPLMLVAFLQNGCWGWEFHTLRAHLLYMAAATAVNWLAHTVVGLIIGPRMQGKSVGLHPVTIIVSLFIWTLLLGGALGAILAIPLTAMLKVLLVRYVWGKDPVVAKPT